MKIQLGNLGAIYKMLINSHQEREPCRNQNKDPTQQDRMVYYNDATIHYPLKHVGGLFGRKDHQYICCVHLCPQHPGVFRKISRLLEVSGIREDLRWDLTSENGTGYVLNSNGERIVSFSESDCEDHERKSRELCIGSGGTKQRFLFYTRPDGKPGIPCGFRNFADSIEELNMVANAFIRSCYEGKFSAEGKKLRAIRSSPIYLSL